MSGVPATFGDAFTQVCRAKSTAQSDLAIANDGDFYLVRCGDSFLLSTRGVSLLDVNGREVEYSWEELDFVLPGDLSLAADKLKTTTDLHTPAENIARVAGRWCAYAALAWLVYFVLTTVIGGLWDTYWSLHQALWYFGDMIFFGGLALIGCVLAPFVIPIVIGAFATGGLVAGLGVWLGRLVYVPVRLIMQATAGSFPNSIVILDAHWVKMPWGTKTTELLDFVMVGVKLRRRGLS